MIGAIPFWSRLRGNALLRAALTGANAAVVVLLLGASGALIVALGLAPAAA